MRVLIVEDNAAFSLLVATRLEKSGIESDQAATAEQAARAISTLNYAAIVLDLGLPDRDGLHLLRDLRLRGDATPILIMTARHNLQDRVTGLREGADDYLVKPFALDELVARLLALMRRPGKLLSRPLLAGNVALDVENHQVSINGRVQLIRLRETSVLEILLRHRGNVVSRRFFEDQLFGIVGERDSNTVDVYIHRLRKQLADAGATLNIQTIRGVGYILSENAQATNAT